MAQRNQARQRQETVRTHEGGRAQKGDYARQLRRAVTSCLLWEDTFYESGVDIATRIHTLANQCDPDFVADLAREVRKQHGLRHAPLWLVISLLPHSKECCSSVGRAAVPSRLFLSPSMDVMALFTVTSFDDM